MNVTLPDGRVLTLPRHKMGVMGRPGTGKSTLMASMAIETANEVYPLLVFASDPEEKLTPYFDRCAGVERKMGQFGQPIFVGTGPKSGKPLIQIEQFYDEEPKSPKAITALLARAEQLRGEVDAGLWASFVLDSWTQYQTMAIWRRSFGPMAVKDADSFGRAHGAAAADLKALVQARVMPLKCNVGIVFHTTEVVKEESGERFFGIKAIGKDLPTELASLLPERYRATAEADGVTRRLWTRPDGRFDLCTLIDAPSPCPNDFKALWANWIAKRAAIAAQPASATPAPKE